MTDIGEIKHMSALELRHYGMPKIAYIKRVEVNGEVGYAVHAADGTRVAMLPDRALAFVTARLHDVEPLSVH
jgi:hypothetical protein